MMATQTALQRLARRALLERLKASAELIALIPVGNINPDGVASWPFVLVQSPRTLRLRASCVRGASVSFDVHAFAGPREESGSVVETGYDHASRIGSAIEAALGDTNITLENGANCRVRFSDTQLLPDGEPDAWHWIAQANCRVLSA